MHERKIVFSDMVRALGKKELYLDISVLAFVCVPAVLVVLSFALKIDRYLGLKPLISHPYNSIAFFILSISGGLIIWRAYTYLIVIGEGSPCPQMGGTKKMVTCGPYARVRHPSVIGKLMGIIGIGCLFQATFFTFVIIPLLCMWSAFYNRFIQEKGCVEKFGEEYLNYRKNTPMFIPKLKSAGFFSALICFLIFAGICYYPLSAHPFRYALSHRTASAHAVLMYYFADYLRGISFSHFDIWAYPYGGIAKVIAVPSMAMGTLLCQWVSTRAAFNLLFMLNLVLSSMSFYLVGRSIGLKTISAITLGLLVVFNSCLQSFILRAQIENTLLWTVGFAILSIISLLTGKKRVVPFIGVCVFVPLILFSTPYYMIFFICLCPFLFLFLMRRFDIAWNDPRVLWLGVSALTMIVLTAGLVEFYRPAAIEFGSGRIDLFPGSLKSGLSISTRIDSMVDLVRPGGLLYKERPYLGIALVSGLLLSLIYRIRSRRRQRGAVILWAGTIFFLLLIMGRSIGGSGSSGVPLLAAFIDRIYPDFQNVIKLYRAIPFMALCAGLLIASVIDRLNFKRAILVFLALVIVTIADNFAVRLLSEYPARKFYYDEWTDMDPVIRALPKNKTADFPVADLPPPQSGTPGFWERYVYFQTEHHQKLVWVDADPEPARALMGRLLDFYHDPALYREESEKADMLGDELRNAGVGLVILHKEFAPHEKAVLIVSVLDSLFPRFSEGERIIAWQVKDRTL